MKLRTLLQTLTFVTASGLAMAGSGTIAVLDGGGVSRTFDVVTDGSGNFIAKNVICDQSAAANCAGVDAGKSLQVAGEGTAGSAAGGVVTVQGVASMTPVLATVSQATAASLNATVVGTGTFATQVNGFTSWAGGTLGSMANYGTSPGAVLVPGVNAFVTNANANGQATMANSSPVTLASNQSVGDPCTFQAKTNVPISTASGTVALVAGVSAKKIYVCSFSLIASGAIAVSLSEGSGTTCGTSSQAGVIGVATNGTAANGLSLAANGGITLGSGNGTIAQTATAANYLCLFQSGTTQIAGNLTYVQQ